MVKKNLTYRVSSVGETESRNLDEVAASSIIVPPGCGAISLDCDQRSTPVLKLLKDDWFHEDGFPIAVARRDRREPFGLHSHEFSEIVIVTGGKGVHTTGDESYEIVAGDTFVIGGDRPHEYVKVDRLNLILILFDPADLPVGMGDLSSLPGYHALFTLEPAWRKRHEFRSRLRLDPGELVYATRLVDELETELSNREPGFGSIAIGLWLQLATFLSRCYVGNSNRQSQSLLRIAEAISHIERNYAESITLDELIEISGMSRRSFLRAFEAAIGCPPITYLIRLRIRHACQLLQTSRATITQIAMRVGFSDSNYFSRQFRAITGVAPGQYRKHPRALAEVVPTTSTEP